MIARAVILHHTSSLRDTTTLGSINNWHRVRFNFRSSLGFFVGYHYVILGNGQVHQTRRDNELGAHSVPNEGRVGVCLTGNFETETPSPNQLASLSRVLDKLKKDYGIGDEMIFGHLEKSRTACPGKNLMEWLIAYRKVGWLKRQIQKLRLRLSARGG